MERILLLASQVITALDQPPIRNGGIRIAGRRIEAIGTEAELRSQDPETVFRFDRATLLPGLIDCHEHLLGGHDRYATSLTDPTVVEPDMMFGLIGTFHARRLLDEGITTARVLGSPGHIDLLIRRAIKEGYVEGPRLICAGRNLSMTGGHYWIPGIEVDGPDEAAKAARMQLKAGADFIKVMASGGVSITRLGEEPSQPELTIDEMAAVVRVAHSAGRRVTAHADGVPGILNALDARVDCIEHGIFLTSDQAKYMAEHSVSLVPTLSTMEELALRGQLYGVPESWIGIANTILEPHRSSFRSALEAGVHFAAGTDGYASIVDEIKALASFGLSPYRAIQSATRDAALVIEPSPEFGTLKPNLLADVIAVTGDPLESLDALRDVQLVMCEGVIKRRFAPKS